MNDEQFFLANAYLDGELTDDERAIAESDPEVMAEVEELRALQATMRDVAPPTDAAREAAVAAAMAEFGPAPAATRTVGEAASTVTFRPRPSYAKYLAVAAGVLGVGLFGVAVANLGTGGDDDAATDEPAAEEPAEEPAVARLTEDDTFAADGEASEEMATAEVPADEPAAAMADEPADEPAEEPASEPAEEPAEGPAEDADGGVERPVLLPDQVLTTPEELGSFGTGLLEQQAAGTLPPTPNHACPIDNVLGRAEYRVADDVGGEISWLLVAVDEPAAVVLGIDETSCDLVVAGPLYLP